MFLKFKIFSCFAFSSTEQINRFFSLVLNYFAFLISPHPPSTFGVFMCFMFREKTEKTVFGRFLKRVKRSQMEQAHTHDNQTRNSMEVRAESVHTSVARILVVNRWSKQDSLQQRFSLAKLIARFSILFSLLAQSQTTFSLPDSNYMAMDFVIGTFLSSHHPLYKSADDDVSASEKISEEKVLFFLSAVVCGRV